MSDRSHALDVEIRAAALDEVPLIQQVAIDADTRYAATGHAALADGSTIPTAVAVRAIESNSLAVACVDDRVVGWVYTARIDGEPRVVERGVRGDRRCADRGWSRLVDAGAHAVAIGGATRRLKSAGLCRRSSQRAFV